MVPSQRARNLHTLELRALFELAKEIPHPIDLGIGMPDIAIPQPILENLRVYLDAPRGAYSVGAGDLLTREAVCKKLLIHNQITATPEEVILTNGTNGGLMVSLFSLLDPGSEIVIIEPYFVVYKQLIDFIGAKAVIIPSYPNWRLPLEGIQAAVNKNTRAILINAPNNPTGAVYTRKELEELTTIADRYQTPIISDEIYEDYVYDRRSHVSIGSWYPQTITLMGPSKSDALAGWRIGYLHAPEEWVSSLLSVQQLFYVCAPTMAQCALRTSLSLSHAHLRSIFEEKRNYIRQELSGYLPTNTLEGAFYAFFNIGRPSNDFVTKLAKREGVILAPGKIFSDTTTYVRLSYGTNFETLKQGVTSLKAFLEKNSH